VESKHKGAEAGDWKLSAGKYFADASDKGQTRKKKKKKKKKKKNVSDTQLHLHTGLQTATDARFYQISAAFGKEASNEKKPLVLQYEVKHEQNIDCGGGYVKLLPAGLDQSAFNGDSDYNIMFGPDICGATKRVHVIFNYKGKNHLLNKEIPCESDAAPHLYTLIVKPDNTYAVLIDNVEKQTGSLKEDWDMLLPKEINDPNASKPSDWDDRSKINDPEDKKPEGWDSIPAQIKDASATKPDDWDDELDGEWEAPLIDNPEYKGEWLAKQIDNPAYKGPWVHPKVANPDFVDDNTLGQYKSHKFVGILRRRQVVERERARTGGRQNDVETTRSGCARSWKQTKIMKRSDGSNASASKAKKKAAKHELWLVGENQQNQNKEKQNKRFNNKM
jgi:calreticulin